METTILLETIYVMQAEQLVSNPYIYVLFIFAFMVSTTLALSFCIDGLFMVYILGNEI